jgi:hypothetical protein
LKLTEGIRSFSLICILPHNKIKLNTGARSQNKIFNFLYILECDYRILNSNFAHVLVVTSSIGSNL